MNDLLKWAPSISQYKDSWFSKLYAKRHTWYTHRLI